ncbi:YdgA family protein [Desulfovibrio sp. TomC]|uniref:YdgA family protein n=1 Tax=Desulfovibrio sp. TomC TaxID=1562888 RepID=UPI0005742D04|nr:DUF945 family protein [Desulfovibrio sp. TomC]KHK00888.1 hypothetical protein NY78_3668 [Desulfovibrio sp. TomC]
MKKIVLGLLLILALGIPASSYWLGTRLDGVLEAQRSLLEAQYGIPITLLEKKQGVFSSTYRYEVRLAPGLDPGSALPPFEVVGVVAHGPIPFAAGSLRPALAVMDLRLALPAEAQTTWGNIQKAIPELQQTSLRTVFAFSGDSNTRFAVPPVTRAITQKDGTALDVHWKAVTGRLDMTADLGVIDMALDAPDAGLSDKTMVLSLQGFSLTSNAKRVGLNLYVGTSRLSLAGLKLTNSVAAENSFALNQLAITAQTDVQNGALDSAMTTQCQSLMLPGLAKVSLDMAVSLKNLDAAALDTAASEFRRLNLQKMSPQEMVQAYGDLLRRHGAAIASRGPRLALDRFLLGLPSGPVEATASVTAAGSGALPETVPAALARLTAVASLKTSLAAIMDLAAAAGKSNPALAGASAQPMVEAAVAGLAAQGYVVRDKDGLSAAVAWDGKTLTVNGKPLNPAMP